jgi:tetrahydromethanopterin S-methyltransferase subunit G
MWLREVVLQGFFGVERPSRVTLDPGLCNLALPEGIEPASFREVLLALLFPNEISQDRLSPWVVPGVEPRLGAVISLQRANDPAPKSFKLSRKLDPESAALREAETNRELVRGAEEVARYLQTNHGLPSLRDFELLQLWDFAPFLKGTEPPPLSQPRPAAPSLSPEVARLAQEWRRATRVEELELELDSLRFDLKERRERTAKLGGLSKRKEELNQKIEVLEARLRFTDAEWALLREADKKVHALRQRAEELEGQVEQARAEQQALAPQPLGKEYGLWGGVVGSVLVFVVSAASGVRLLALLDIVLLGVSALAFIRRLERREQAHAQGIRAEQVYLHIEQTQKERADLERQSARLLGRAKVESVEHLHDLQREKDSLESDRDNLQSRDERSNQGKLDEVQRELADLEARAKQLEAERDTLGRVTTPSYELEHMLHERGVDARTLPAEQAAPPKSRPSRAGRTPLELFRAVREAAVRAGLSKEGPLSEKTLELWQRFGKHALGERFAKVDLDEQGKLCAEEGAEKLEQWAQRHPEQLQLLAALLCASFMATAPRHTSFGGRSLFLYLPYADAKALQRFEKVSQYLAKYLQVVVLEAGEAAQR